MLGSSQRADWLTVRELVEVLDCVTVEDDEAQALDGALDEDAQDDRLDAGAHSELFALDSASLTRSFTSDVSARASSCPSGFPGLCAALDEGAHRGATGAGRHDVAEDANRSPSNRDEHRPERSKPSRVTCGWPVRTADEPTRSARAPESTVTPNGLDRADSTRTEAIQGSPGARRLDDARARHVNHRYISAKVASGAPIAELLGSQETGGHSGAAGAVRRPPPSRPRPYREPSVHLVAGARRRPSWGGSAGTAGRDLR